MKYKFSMIIIFCFLLNTILVHSQESKCPPDCSNPSKITKDSYLNPESYKNKDFYKNSDSKKWNFLDPNFDYSKIPIEKYRELPYENPSIDHSKLNLQKYISAFGCSSCTFRLATTQKLIFSINGVLHPKTGLAKIPSNYPPNTLFVATKEGIFIVLPKTDKKFRLDTTDIGSATIVTNNQKVTLSNGYVINGRLSFIDNKPLVAINNELTIEGIKIKPKGNDVLVYFDGKEHQGNYVSYGQKNLIAQGNNFDLEFTSENRLVKVFGQNIALNVISRYGVLERPMLDALIQTPSKLLQDDYLYISLGDGKSKSGKITLTNLEDRNLLSLFETKGFVNMWNDRNQLTVDDNRVTQNYYSTIPNVRQGSVSMQLIAGEDKGKIYTFDENRRIFILTPQQSKEIDELRENIIKKHNIILTGFFSSGDLHGFDNSLTKLENLGIDFSRFKEIKGKNLEIIEGDTRTQRFATEIELTFEPEVTVVWFPIFINEPKSYTITIYDEVKIFLTPSFGSGLVHEMGHILGHNNPRLDEKFIQKGREFGISFNTLPIKVPSSLIANKGPKELFPNFYAEKNFNEFKAEIFEEMVLSPEWFEKSLDDEYRKKKGLPLLSEDVYKKRQAFRNIWLEELNKYKKTK